MIKLCIFDLDGTIINSLNDIAVAMNYALDKNGFPTHSINAYKSFIGSGVIVMIERATANTNASDNDKKQIHIDFSEYYNVHKTDTTVPYENCTNLLQQLSHKGIYLAVNTNKPHNFTTEIVKKLYPTINFNIIFGKKDDIPIKPNPYGVNYILRKLNINKNECLYIGDSDVDVLTAKNAGVHFCGVEWGFKGYDVLKNLNAENIVSSPMQILEIVEIIK